MSSRPKSEGFGFVPAESEHHFLVTIPSHETRIHVYLRACDMGREPDRRELILPSVMKTPKCA